jgi:hypothetical protein
MRAMTGRKFGDGKLCLLVVHAPTLLEMSSRFDIVPGMNVKPCSDDCPLCALDVSNIKDDRWDVVAPVDDHAGMEALAAAYGSGNRPSRRLRPPPQRDP